MRFCARFGTALIYLYIGSLRDLGTVPAQENSSIDIRGDESPTHVIMTGIFGLETKEWSIEHVVPNCTV